jgi:hypothetical protein
MPKFKATAVYYTYCTVEIEAENADHAEEIAKDMDGGDFTPSNEHFDWHINNVSEIE